jgi:hypothetical protein
VPIHIISSIAPLALPHYPCLPAWSFFTSLCQSYFGSYPKTSLAFLMLINAS